MNLVRRLGVDPELALRQTNQKFRQRFAAMENATDRPLEQQSPEQLEALWAEAKQENCPNETALSGGRKVTTPAPEILIRKCSGFEEFDACVRLQTDIWGYDVQRRHSAARIHRH